MFWLLRESLDNLDNFFNFYLISSVFSFNQRHKNELLHGIFVFEMRLGCGEEETVFNFQETSSSIEIIDNQTV